MAFQKLGTAYNLPSKTPPNPYNTTNNTMATATKPDKTGTVVEKHVDVDSLLEDYAWRLFKDMSGIKKGGLDQFRGLDREDVEFIFVSYNYLFLPFIFILFSGSTFFFDIQKFFVADFYQKSILDPLFFDVRYFMAFPSIAFF